jgi:hypothetical protein
MKPKERLAAVQDDINKALADSRIAVEFVEQNCRIPKVKVLLNNYLVVSIVSIVEEGFRSIVREYISCLEDEIEEYQKLHKELIETNVRSAAALLIKTISSSKGIDASQITRLIYQCYSGEPGFKLFKDEIAHNQSNLKSTEITRISKAIGVRSLWLNISGNASIKEYFSGHRPEQLEFALVEKWNGLFDERDTIVHRFSQASGWGDTIILDYIDMCARVMNSISECLALDAESLITSSRSTDST